MWEGEAVAGGVLLAAAVAIVFSFLEFDLIFGSVGGLAGAKRASNWIFSSVCDNFVSADIYE